MANLLAQLGIADNDYLFNSRVGQDTVFEVANEFIRQREEQVNRAYAVFIDGTTQAHTERIKLPGSSYMAETGLNDDAPDAKVLGGWDVSYELRNFTKAISYNDVARGYMTAEEFTLQVNNIVTANTNTMRRYMLRMLFNNTQKAFTDETLNDLELLVQPLANGDAVRYPPLAGVDDTATANHYIESGYIPSAVSNTNDPFVTAVDLLEATFNSTENGENIVTFVSPLQRSVYEALSSFEEVPDNYIRTSSLADIPVGLPQVPGKIYGRHKRGTWVVGWPNIPDGYLLSVHLDRQKPIKMRLDPSGTGISQGLQLVHRDERGPVEKLTWRNRYGFGVGMRLNGVVIELANGGSYTIPSIFA